MEINYQQGDLTDIIIRAQGGNTAAEAASPAVPTADWQFPSNIPVVDYSTEPGLDYFGDPFTHFGDPLIHDIETPVSVSGFFHNRSSFEEPGSTVGFASTGGNININIGQEVINSLDDEMKRPNSFSGMLQISPVNAKLPVTRCESPAPLPAGSNGPPVLISNDQGLQISSPRNTGIRRRKSQAKKVVCIPAPAPVNSRPSGEIVPSDLWAWRKYGQKPIKGSPYPRGYYRCSSSKGCSARKQVERSRTDPNMLVITYTSEHNHPWPTQRNALAGSTRSQPSKGNCKSPSNNSQAPQKSPNSKEEGKGISPEEDTVPVKEENMDPLESDNQLETDGGPDFDQGFPDSYKPILPDSNNQSEDNFFADLEEIEADSSLDIFGFSGDDGRDVRVLNPFNFYDWAVNSNAGGGASPGGATSNMEL